MKRKITNKITLKLVLLIIIAFIISFTTFIFIFATMFSYILKNVSNISGQHVIKTYHAYLFLLVLAPIIVFLFIFILGIKRRLKYLGYISNSLLNIHNKTYLEEIKIKGHDEISELAKNINIMSNRLKENYENEKRIIEAKNELIVAVSHDLKSPLTSIIGYLDLLNNSKFKYDAEQTKYLSIAYAKSIGLKKLILELFEYTQLSSENIILDKTTFNILILINQIVGEYVTFFNNKNINVSITSNCKEANCKIDIQKMMRVIENIIKNAEKYSIDNTEFKISILEFDNEIKIIFQNIGENIKEEELIKMFESMYRLDKSRNSNIEGSGLGLAISKKIVELHNGKIWAECYDHVIKINILLKKA